MSPDLPSSAQVVVVGGGVMGASAAYHLTRGGCTDVVLLERDTLGSGSTRAAAGGIRAQFSDELNIRIGLECLRRFERFADEIGAPIDFRRDGYLFLLKEEHVAAFRESARLQRDLGVPVEVLTPEDAAAIVPGLFVGDLAAATFNPEDAAATPDAVVQGYASAARRAGATVIEGCAVRGIAVRSGRVAGVETAHGPIATRTVLCTAGVWTRELAATAGLDVPVRAERRHVWTTDPLPDQPASLPLTIDFETSFYFHPEGDGLLFGARTTDLDEVIPLATHRLPPLGEIGLRGGWSGDYEMSPDHNAMVGMADDPAGLGYATGFSGHGFQQAPVVGEHLAELALGRDPTFDLSAFSLDRFARGAARAEHNVV